MSAKVRYIGLIEVNVHALLFLGKDEVGTVVPPAISSAVIAS